MDPTLLGYLALAVATLAAAFVGAWSSVKSNRRTKTNHGKTIGQHVEEAARSAEQAHLTAQLVALQLERYKSEQAAADLVEHNLIEGYVSADLAAHQELRSLILQVAAQRHDPPTS